MIPILFRTLIIYMLLGGAMRLMGKRQIAQLEMSELITTLLLSELAALPIENGDIPLLHVMIPVITLMTLEIGASVLLTHCPSLRRKESNTPSILICRGEIMAKELTDNRMSLDELFAGLRQQGIHDPTEVEYAILEKNGLLSVLPWAKNSPTTPNDLSLSVPEEGMMHLVISDGAVNSRSLAHLHKDAAWVEDVCRQNHISPADVYCLMCNDAGRTVLIPRNNGKKKEKKRTAVVQKKENKK